MTAIASTTLNETVPRYTSYPTAPHFHAGIGPVTVRNWIDGIRDGETISLYLHIPFCDRLCWFCACHTKQTRQYGPVAEYLRALRCEIETVGGLVRKRAKVGAIHFGGGSPTMLTPADMTALMAALGESFDIEPDASISVEIDPNDMDEARLDALAAIGMTRASLGIQDFDSKVQKAINRLQSFEQTKAVVDGVRQRGARSVNLDLLYGLPHQTTESVVATVKQVLTLRPDRLALFGYAHVPWFKKHQTMIDEAWLPDSAARLTQFLAAGEAIVAAGYVAIGLDHFALPGDSLAQAAATGNLRRNFQGYTDDKCETLIGLGPSAISQFREGHAQNVPATGIYEKTVTGGELATVRGIALSLDDMTRAWVIERLMCDFGFSAIELVERFGLAGQSVLSTASRLAQQHSSHMLEIHGDRFVVPRECRPLIRSVAARFDRYLNAGNARHSLAV